MLRTCLKDSEMVSQLTNFVGNQLQPKSNPNKTQQTQQTQGVKPAVKVVGNPNPFNGNPFVAPKTDNSPTFGKNMPVQGGFFAGYHDGKPNIVGAKLFVEV